MNSNHVVIINALANVYVVKNDLDRAVKVIEHGILKHEFNADVNYNAGMIYFLCEDYQKALYHFIWFQILNEKEKDIVEPYKEEIKESLGLNKYTEVADLVIWLSRGIYINFPGKSNDLNTNIIGDFFAIQGKEYYVAHYVKNNESYFLNTQLRSIPVEVVPGRRVKEFKITCKGRQILPIMPLSENQKIEFSYGEDYCNQQLDKLRYHYYTFEKEKDVSISSDSPFVVGHPISQNPFSEKPRLILNIFVDGLSQMFIEDEGLENIMPNTYSFFKKGTIFTNAYAAGEWTYVSLANYFTGNYTMNHRQFHPEFNSQVLKKLPIFPEIFEENGYFCAKIDGDWRSLPVQGYAKGMGRVLYHHGHFGSKTTDVISEALEHLYAFHEVNNFLWICLPDLHDIADESVEPISMQINTPIVNRTRSKTDEPTARKKFDTDKCIRYREGVKRIDMYLASLYHFINDHYCEDEYIVSLFSDHGQSFLKETSNFLDVHRTHIPVMLRGKNIPEGISSELIQSMDLFPMILHCMGIDEYSIRCEGKVAKHLGGKSERNYVFSESLFPNSPYRATFVDYECKVFLNHLGIARGTGVFRMEILISKYSV